MDNPKTIGNVNFLNLVNATPESVAGIRHIENINVAVYTPETVSLLHQMDPGNVNATIEIPTGANMVMKTGMMQVNAGFFKNVERRILSPGHRTAHYRARRAGRRDRKRPGRRGSDRPVLLSGGPDGRL